MKSILFLSLIVLCLSSPKKAKESFNTSDIFANIKKAIYQCVSSSEEASKQLKELVNKDSMSSMSTDALNLNNTSASLLRISEQLRQAINKIGVEIDLFKV